METLTTQELKSKRAAGDNLTLINTLPHDAFEKAHIPDSVNIPLESPDFAAQVEQTVGGKDRPVVVYCASRECDSSTKAARRLEEAGFATVYDFEGGVQDWQQAGEPVASGA